MKRALMLASVASMIDLFNKNNINILHNLGYKVDVAANFNEGSITSQERVDEFYYELLADNINIYNIPIPRSIFKMNKILKSYKMIKKIVNENYYDIIHCHSPIGGVLCRLACRKARKHGTKVIYTAHGFHFFNGASIKAWILFYPIEKFCSRFTDLLITINQEDYNRATKFHQKKLEYIPGIGVNVNKISSVCIDRDLKRKELGLQSNDFVFMSTGQLSTRKNHQVIIKALARINNPNVKYLIVGIGELENKLRELASDLNVSNRVIFTGYRNDISELLYCANCFAFPSIQEGLPVALMEAMASGLPVICSRIRGNVDLVVDGEGGFVFDYDDAIGFSNGMKKIINCENSKEMGKKNIQIIKNFDINIVNKKMEELYKNI